MTEVTERCFTVNLQRSNGKGCPACAGLVATPKNCLATLRPDLASEWHDTLNFPLTPHDVTLKSDKYVWWKCKDKTCNSIWQVQVKHRSNETGCPKCASGLRTSLPEQAIYYYLQQIFNDTLNGYKFPVKSGRPLECDIYTPSLNLVIEYDGYRHKSNVTKERDERKNKFFNDNQIKLLRIRGADYPSIEAYNSSVIMADTKNMKFDTLKTLLGDIRRHIVDNFNVNEYNCSLLNKWSNINIEDDRMQIVEKTKTRVLENSLANRYPELVRDAWDYQKNAPLDPDKVSYGSGIKAWWKCQTCKASYQYRIDSKRRGLNGCKNCRKEKLPVLKKVLYSTNSHFFSIKKNFRDTSVILEYV